MRLLPITQIPSFNSRFKAALAHLFLSFFVSILPFPFHPIHFHSISFFYSEMSKESSEFESSMSYRSTIQPRTAVRTQSRQSGNYVSGGTNTGGGTILLSQKFIRREGNHLKLSFIPLVNSISSNLIMDSAAFYFIPKYLSLVRTSPPIICFRRWWCWSIVGRFTRNNEEWKIKLDINLPGNISPSVHKPIERLTHSLLYSALFTMCELILLLFLPKWVTN